MATEQMWRFSQCFGDKTDTIEVADADIISTVSFDRTGEFLASGDRAGRVVLFKRNSKSTLNNNLVKQDPSGPLESKVANITTDTKEKSARETKKNGPMYQFYFEFQSHEAEFDYLKSLEIHEKINKIVWFPRENDSLHMLTTNDKTIKLWRVAERTQQSFVQSNSMDMQRLISRQNLQLPRLIDEKPIIAAAPRRVYSNAHAYHIHSVALNSDGETFLSADDLRINLWNINGHDNSFTAVDLKPASIEELSEVITTATFHPSHCNLFAYGTSKGLVQMCDTRVAALCDHSAYTFDSSHTSEGQNTNFFGELTASVSDVAFSPDGKRFVTRDYLTSRVWDIANPSRPLATIPVHDAIRPRLCELYENDCIFDKFEATFNYDASLVLSGSYSNLLRVAPSDGSQTNHHLIHADKSIFRSGSRRIPSKQSTSSSSSSFSVNGELLERSGSTESSREWNFDRKILHFSPHPRENTVAIAALSNLFIFTQQQSI